jgi:hypothetical protein
VLKYSAAGSLTAIYGLATYRIITKQVPLEPLAPQKAVVTVAALMGATWLATLL